MLKLCSCFGYWVATFANQQAEFGQILKLVGANLKWRLNQHFFGDYIHDIFDPEGVTLPDLDNKILKKSKSLLQE
jgi:hypothetical protein